MSVKIAVFMQTLNDVEIVFFFNFLLFKRHLEMVLKSFRSFIFLDNVSKSLPELCQRCRISKITGLY